MGHDIYYNFGLFMGYLLVFFLVSPLLLYVLYLVLTAVLCVMVVWDNFKKVVTFLCTPSRPRRVSFNGYTPVDRNPKRIRDDNIPIC